MSKFNFSALFLSSSISQNIKSECLHGIYSILLNIKKCCLIIALYNLKQSMKN